MNGFIDLDTYLIDVRRIEAVGVEKSLDECPQFDVVVNTRRQMYAIRSFSDEAPARAYKEEVFQKIRDLACALEF